MIDIFSAPTVTLHWCLLPLRMFFAGLGVWSPLFLSRVVEHNIGPGAGLLMFEIFETWPNWLCMSEWNLITIDRTLKKCCPGCEDKFCLHSAFLSPWSSLCFSRYLQDEFVTGFSKFREGSSFQDSFILAYPIHTSDRQKFHTRRINLAQSYTGDRSLVRSLERLASPLSHQYSISQLR